MRCRFLSACAGVLAVGWASLGGFLPGAAQAELYWVFLADKTDRFGDLQSWSPKGQNHLDLPVDEAYVRQLAAWGGVRQRSRWFNAVSIDLASAEQAATLSQLSFVVAVAPVGTGRRRPAPVAMPARRPMAPQQEYGPSFFQANLIGVPFLHARNLRGQGVRIAILDVGFNWRDHRAFQHLNVIAERDFINDDDNVADEVAEPVTGDEAAVGQNEHGTRVLGLLAGDHPGQLIGIAPDAEYLLAKTENVLRELPVEEDRWIAGLEWADSMGAQVVNSSLGYTEFDDGTGYTYGDLDGRTALTTRAAQIAVERGVVIVAAAGNEGNKPWRYITAPADAEGVLAVGAVQVQNSTIAPFSSRGPTADGRLKPDVVAPGQSVYTVSGNGSIVPGAFDLEEYVRLSGTSFAAPLVSGVTALMLQADPTRTPRSIIDAVRRTATDLGPAGPDTVFGYGLVNAVAAVGLEEALPEASVAEDPFPNPVRGAVSTVYFPFELAADDMVSLAIFDVAGSLVSEVAPQPWPAGTYTSPGQALTWRVPPRLASGIYYYRLSAASLHRLGSLAILRD